MGGLFGGGGSGGGARTPIEQPNTLESAQRLKIIDLLCEGVANQDVSFKNIYLDNTPIQNADGTYNFTGIRVAALPGTHNQDYLAGFDSTDKIVAVGAEVKAATSITRTVTDPLVDSVRVTLALGSLVTMKDNGDRVGGSVSLTVMCGTKSYPVTISGKTTSAYHQDVLLTDLPDAPFNISVHRNTPDSTTDGTSNATHWVSYVESIDAKFNYPNSVVVGLEIDSAQFGGKIPTRTYRNQWTQIKIPNNYDPITRTYEGIWLGEFKTAWSNNPAWVFYDLVTDKRYGLGDRLGDFGCDKWSLYQIAKYCDQIVPDGFGNHEPRFTCNAYLSEPRDAKSLLDDLASVFRGIAVWDGQMVTALQDAKKDPVATYSNSNVVDGMFAYSGAAQKSIFTAAHVKYNDKTDNYATKTEYVADDNAIKRYGLNVKQITAFGCTSRGQAARVGKWLIETSIRERQMVSFSVGREGIRHLPFDIIEIADNDYAGDMIGGRVLSVTGNTITVDRPMSAINSIRYYANGQSKVVSVTAVQYNTITLLNTPIGIEQLSVFSATKTDVKPRLFRALSIKEDDGTYTISAVQHDENKEAIVDQGITFEQDDTATKHKPQVSYGRVSKDGDELVLAWEGINTTQYLIKIYKDGELYNSYTQEGAEIKLKGLSNGEYRAEIRGKSASGELTEAVIKEWSIDYDIKGLKATPELFAIKLDWTNPTTVINKAKIEIYRSQTADRSTATKVATLSYPTDTFTQNGVKLSETLHFWLRLIDDQGNTGDWVTISGTSENDSSKIIDLIQGSVDESVLASGLRDKITDITINKGLLDDFALDTEAAIAGANQAITDAEALIADAKIELGLVKTKTDSLEIEYEGNKTAVSQSITALNNKDVAMVQRVSALDTDYQGNKTAVSNSLTALSNNDSARVQEINELKTKTDSTNADLVTTKNIASSNTQAIAQTKTELTANYNQAIQDADVEGRNFLVTGVNHYSIETYYLGYRFRKLNAPLYLSVTLKDASIYVGDIYIYLSEFSHVDRNPPWTTVLGANVLHMSEIQISSKHNWFSVYPATEEVLNRVFRRYDIKIEKGLAATAWTPALEDTTRLVVENKANIKSVSTAIATANASLVSTSQTLTAKFNSVEVKGRNLLSSNLDLYTLDNYLGYKFSNDSESYYTLSISDLDTSVDVGHIYAYLSETVNPNLSPTGYTAILELSNNPVSRNLTFKNLKNHFSLISANSKSVSAFFKRFNVKIEKGTTATPYSKALEDLNRNEANLAINSVFYRNVSAYRLHDITLSEPLVKGQSYRVIIKAELGADRNSIGMWEFGGRGVNFFLLPKNNTGLYTASFIFDRDTVVDKLSIYQDPSLGSSASSVTSLEIVKDTLRVGQDLTAAVQTLSEVKAGVDGLLAKWSVKVEANGRVGGISLNNNSQTIDFIIAADKFAVVSPSGGDNGTSMIMVLNSPTVIDGITVPAGNYMRDFYAPRGSIGTAQIQDLAVKSGQIDNLAVTTGKIASLAVDTLQIATGAVTIPLIYRNFVYTTIYGAVMNKGIGVDSFGTSVNNFSAAIIKSFTLDVTTNNFAAILTASIGNWQVQRADAGAQPPITFVAYTQNGGDFRVVGLKTDRPDQWGNRSTFLSTVAPLPIGVIKIYFLIGYFGYVVEYLQKMDFNVSEVNLSVIGAKK